MLRKYPSVHPHDVFARGWTEGGLTMPQVTLMVEFAREDDEANIRFQAGIHGAKLEGGEAPDEPQDDFRPDWLPEGVVIGDPSTYEGLTNEQRTRITEEYMKEYGGFFSSFFG